MSSKRFKLSTAWRTIGRLAFIAPLCVFQAAVRGVPPERVKPDVTKWKIVKPKQQIKRALNPALLRRFAFSESISINKISLSPDSKRVAMIETSKAKSILTIRDAETWKVLFSSNPKEQWQSSGDLTFSRDGKLLVGTGYGVRLLNAQTGKLLKVLPFGYGEQLVFSNDGALLGGCDKGGGLCVWDVASGKLLWTHEAQSQETAGIAFSPDDKLLASAGWGERKDKKARLWDARTGKLTKVIGGAYSIDAPLVFSPDGQTLATTGFPPGFKFEEYKRGRNGEAPHATESFYIGQYDYVTMLWDVPSGKLNQVVRKEPLPYHGTGGYAPIGFTSDGRKLIVRGEHEVDVRETDSGKLLRRISNMKSVVASSLSQDGRVLITSQMRFEGNFICFWRVL